jgi:hypothetical protein
MLGKKWRSFKLAGLNSEWAVRLRTYSENFIGYGAWLSGFLQTDSESLGRSARSPAFDCEDLTQRGIENSTLRTQNSSLITTAGNDRDRDGLVTVLW